MAATLWPSTVTDASLTRCTSALITLVIMSAVTVVDEYVEGLPGGARRLGHGEWGLTLPAEQAAGWPLDVGLRIADELLRVQAFALGASEDVNPWNFLHWNRGTRLVRFACTRAGDIWVHGDVPVGCVDERQVDRLLGLVAEGAVAARRAVTERAGEQPPAEGGGWGALG
jgi:Putative bacterial sensory transduction regulator